MNEKSKKANKTTAVGAGQIIGGGLLILTFGIVNLAIGILSAVIPLFTGLASSPLLFFTGLIIGGILIWRGARNISLASGFRKISKIVDDNPVISLINLERRVFWSRKKLLSELKRQRKNGFWPGSYIDMTGEVFVQDYELVSAAEETSEEVQENRQGSINSHIDELKTLGKQITDEEFKAHIEKLTSIAGQIYTYVEEHPEKESIIRQLTNYFLPTTVTLLTRYIELQNQTVKTDSMSEAMQKITEVMITIEAVFKNQLDAVYSEKVMDVDVEIEVLQNMAGV